MSETIGVVAFVVIFYGAFYILAHKAEKEVKAQAKRKLEMLAEKDTAGRGVKKTQKA